MDHGLAFFCLVPPGDAHIEIIDDPAKYLHDVVASHSTSSEDPPSTANLPNTIAGFRVQFPGHSFVSQVRNLQDILDQKETEIETLRHEIIHLRNEKMRHEDEVWDLTTRVRELCAAEKEAADDKRELEVMLAEKENELKSIKTHISKLEDEAANIQQLKELIGLRELEKPHVEAELSQNPPQKLVEIERGNSDVDQESARAFLPKQRVPGNEAAADSPFVPEDKRGRPSVSPSKSESQSTGSPTQFSVPNRKIRNQAANRVHDIAFATEISTSVLTQIRTLQGLLAAKDEELREVKVQNSKLEYEAEGFSQRLKTLDESEQRLKDENWDLETQIHDHIAKERDTADREKRLSTRLMDQAEMNTEPAKAVAASTRGVIVKRDSVSGISKEDFGTGEDNTTPEHSPPPSPIKGISRHSALESETVKTSLGHAQRMIQSLRTNIQREKTEKMETRRLLQEARDELERLRSNPVATSKRNSKRLKKPPRLLGGLQSARSETFADDPNWEDQPDESYEA